MKDLRIHSQRLRLLRETHNLSQDELALRAGISQGYVYKLEKGAQQRVSFAVVHRLARALDVDMNYLLVEPISFDGTEPTLNDSPLLGHAISQARQLDERKQEHFARLIMPILAFVRQCDSSMVEA